MLSSLGARRDRSRSPPEETPPAKIFIQAQQKAQHLRPLDTQEPSHQPQTKPDSQQYQAFVPKIVVQEHREQKSTSPPMPYTYAEAVKRTGTKSPTESQGLTLSATALTKQQPQMLDSQKEKQVQQQQLTQEHLQELDQQEMIPTLPQWQLTQEHKLTMHQPEVVFHVQDETHGGGISGHDYLPQQTALQKLDSSSGEFQSRKAQAMKNRPWCQKPESQKEPAPHPEQELVQATKTHSETTSEMVTVQIDLQHSGGPEPQLQAHALQLRQQPQHLIEPQQEVLKQLPRPALRQTQPHQAVSAKPPHPKTSALPQVKSASEVVVQVQSTGVSQNITPQPTKTMPPPIRVSQAESQSPVFSEPHGSVKSQVLAQSQTCFLAEPQSSMQQQGQAQSHAHGPAVAQVQTWPPVRPSSPMHTTVQDQIQYPVPSHIQLRSHPQSWGPVRPPSPKPPTQVLPQAPAQENVDILNPTHGEAKAHSKTHVQSVPEMKSLPQFMTQPQSQMPPAYSKLPTQSIFQPQMHTWSQVRATSPMSTQHPQTESQPEVQSPSHQWAPNQEPQCQVFLQQRPPIPQSLHQPMDQNLQSQAHPPIQIQWPQPMLQQGSQIRSPGYSQAGPSYTHPQIQPLSQIQQQMRPQAPMHQQAPIGPYDISHHQGQQGQIPQICVRQRQPYPEPLLKPYPQMPPICVRQRQPFPDLPTQPYQQMPPVCVRQRQPYPDPPSQHYTPSLQICIRQRQPYTEPPSNPSTQLPQNFICQPQLYSQPQVYPESSSQTNIQRQTSLEKSYFPAQQPEANLQFQEPRSHTSFQASPQVNIVATDQPKGHTSSNVTSPVYIAPQPDVQVKTQIKVHSPIQIKRESLPQFIPEPKAGSTTQPKVEAQIAQPESQSPVQAKVQSAIQLKPHSLPQPKPQTHVLPQPQIQPQVTQIPKVQISPEERPPTHPFTSQPKEQLLQTNVVSQVNVLPQSQAESPDPCISLPALAQAPHQTYTEAYTKAQALARNGFEEAKHCLQEHILEAINIFKVKCISANQISVKEVSDISY